MSFELEVAGAIRNAAGDINKTLEGITKALEKLTNPPVFVPSIWPEAPNQLGPPFTVTSGVLPLQEAQAQSFRSVIAERDALREELAASKVAVAALAENLKAAQADRDSAGAIVVRMHIAALGEMRGPLIGPVEDVAALRAAAKQAGEALLAESRGVMRGVVVQDTFTKAALDALRKAGVL